MCIRDRTGSCGTKGSGESWEYGIAIYLADGGLAADGGGPGGGSAPRINSFTADPVSVTQGETSRLSWNIEGTGTLTITLQAGSNSPVQIDSGPVSFMVVTPTATTSYVLQVTDDQMRADSAQLTVAVDSGPRIVSFTAAPESITNGSSATLRWETDNAATVTLQVGSATPTSVAVNGSQAESPTASTVYTLMATSASGLSVSDTVTINVGASGDPPTITSFTASALEVCSKSSVTLSWTTTDATALQLQQGSAAFATVTGTSTTISSLTETTTFTLKATNANSTEGVTKSLTVAVRAAAEIISFGATVSEVCSNGPVVLRWQVRNATTVEFREGTDPWEETTATRKTVRPDEDTTYRLRATDECDNAVEEVFPVTVRPSPEINRFAASPSQVMPGGTANLTWSVSHATTVELRRSINDDYNDENIPFPLPPWEEWVDVTGQSSLEAANITIARAYQLRVTNACGSRTSIEVIRVGARPVCNYFYASRDQICSGSSLLLSWSVDNADSIELYTGDTSGTGSWATVSGSSMSVSPTADTVYSLRATNASGTRVCGTFTVRVSTAAPTIDTFSAESTDVAPGTSVDLTYGVSNALTIELRQGSAAWETLRSEDVPFTVSGATVAVTVDEDTTYRLRARNECGSVTSSVAVTITGAVPVISSLTASPRSVADGGSTTVSWTVTGSTSLSIKLNNNAFAAVTGTSKVYTNLREDTLFTLKATNTHGSVQASVQVIVCSKPVIHRFGASPATITPGGGSDLTWRVTGQDGEDDDLTIDQGVGSVNNPIHEENGVRVTPTHTTTYTLTALNDCGSVTETATVTVDRSEANPVIHEFTANPETISSGDSSTLFWRVSAPVGGTITSLSIDQSVGSVLSADNADGVDVSPTASTTYTLTAKSSATNSTTATVTVTVAAATAPLINSFTADLTMITAGQYTVLRWNTSNATSLSLQTGSGTFDTVTGTSLDINPSSTTTYTLRATNGTNSVEAQVTVTVDQRPLIQSFTATPATVYPGHSGIDTSTLAWVVSGATTLSITHVGTVTGTSVTVTPAATTQYRLTATNSHGNTSRNVTVFTSQLPLL